jgi:hypothetical protein
MGLHLSCAWRNGLCEGSVTMSSGLLILTREQLAGGTEDRKQCRGPHVVTSVCLPWPDRYLIPGIIEVRGPEIGLRLRHHNFPPAEKTPDPDDDPIAGSGWLVRPDKQDLPP